jgi:hypothetical protein
VDIAPDVHPRYGKEVDKERLEIREEIFRVRPPYSPHHEKAGSVADRFPEEPARPRIGPVNPPERGSRKPVT